MLERSRLDTVVLRSPMPLHVPQAIAALERAIHDQDTHPDKEFIIDICGPVKPL